IEAVYLLGADEIDTAKLDKTFVIYQGSHGDAGAACADVVLPGTAYTEKSGTYVNTEGRVQRGLRAAFPRGEAKEDWAIIRALSDALGKSLSYSSLGDVRNRMSEVNPIFNDYDGLQAAEWSDFGGTGEPSSEALVSPIENYYMTDPISRVSQTMAECTEAFINPEQQKTGTNG
ncbi:MAG: molybdopterin-dependent oxidoreductase, partial [Alphaproteobacteria bacterium]|nr:molybdopterin-dependent oxidoreductase [Alphaproteobacteria bacterium]